MNKKHKPTMQGELKYTGWQRIDPAPGDKATLYNPNTGMSAHISIQDGDWGIHMRGTDGVYRLSPFWFPEAIDALMPLHFEEKYNSSSPPRSNKRKPTGGDDRPNQK
jgi:hypothetical protein